MLTLTILSAVFWRIDRALLDHGNPSEKVIYVVFIAQWATVALGVIQLIVLFVTCIRLTKLDALCLPTFGLCCGLVEFSILHGLLMGV